MRSPASSLREAGVLLQVGGGLRTVLEPLASPSFSFENVRVLVKLPYVST